LPHSFTYVQRSRSIFITNRVPLISRMVHSLVDQISVHLDMYLYVLPNFLISRAPGGIAYF